jgi:outer membrane lipoprotein carrier protein
MRVLLHTFFCLLFIFCFAGACKATGADTWKALERLRSLTASVNSLRCEFTQTTAIPLFDDPVVSEGKLVFRKPDSLIWEYTAPVAQGLVFSGGRGFRWEEDKSRPIPFSIAEDPVAGLIATQMLAWIRFDQGWIEAHYAVRIEEEEPMTLVLIPKSADALSVLSSISIRFADDGIARTILLAETAGGSTTIQLREVTVNGPVADREFQ